MTEEELKIANSIFDTPKFSKKEIEDTGAKLEDVDFESFKMICQIRKDINSPIYFLFNGLTTGNHKSLGHPAGKAFDIRVPRKNFYEVFKRAIDAGFKKIGVYWNGTAYSYHIENSATSAFWMGTKKAPGKGSWKFGQLILDPKKII